MAAEYVLATRSEDKLREIFEIIGASSGIRLVTLADLQVAPAPAEDDVESHETFVRNALAKARYFAGLTGRPTLADDSGLMVDALEGRPGVRTKRFAADHGYAGGDVDQANNRLLLQLLSDIPDAQRGAQYVCAAALAFPDDTSGAVTTLGTCRGIIAHEPRGAGGFGYDPLFFIPDLNATFAELSPAQKNARSHRALAFRSLIAHLKQPSAGR